VLAHSPVRRLLGCLAVWALILVGCNVTPAEVVHPPSGIEVVWVVDPADLGPAQQTLVLTLQGLVASGPAVIWIVDPGMDALLLDGLEEEGAELRPTDDVWSLVAAFRDQVQGAVLFDLGTDSINVATSLCGPMQAVAVDASLQEEAEVAGMPILADVRGYDEVRAFDEYGDLFTGREAILVEQGESKNAHLRDFAVARQAFTLYGVDPEDHARIAGALGPDLTVYGWGGDEYAWVHQLSTEGGAGIPADWSRNLSVMQRMPATLPERPHPDVQPARQGERIVAFVMSDGDNIQWMGGQFATREGFWASPHRGEFDMTWEMAPLLSEVSPRTLAYFYETAARQTGGRQTGGRQTGGRQTGLDDFVTGPSGVGYAFHNYLPDREAFAERTASAVAATDLSIATMLNASGGMEQSAELLAQPQVMGVIYKDYSPYNAKEGRIFWHEGKPCVSYRYLLWVGKHATSPEGVAESIAQLPADPQNDPDSYALINVHAWSFEEMGGPMEAVAQTVDMLPRRTRVVTAEEFFTLLRDNFGKPTIR